MPKYYLCLCNELEYRVPGIYMLGTLQGDGTHSGTILYTTYMSSTGYTKSYATITGEKYIYIYIYLEQSGK